MKRTIFLLLICSIFAWSGSAFGITFTMINFGSDDVSSIQASVTDIAGGAKVTVDVSGGPIIADITGIFFDLDPYVIPTAIQNDPYPFTADENSVQKAPNNSNMGGSIPKFDVGVGIGATGLSDGGSPDDFQMVMFEVLGVGLVASDFTRLGVRLQSVGTAGSSRDGSAKYVGNPVPEPTTMLLFGAGLLGLAGFSRRKFKK